MLQFYKTIHLYLKNKKVSDENMELATMYYDFVNDYSNMFNIKTFIEKEKIRSDEKTNAVVEILNEYYINGTMFCFFKK